MDSPMGPFCQQKQLIYFAFLSVTGEKKIKSLLRNSADDTKTGDEERREVTDAGWAISKQTAHFLMHPNTRCKAAVTVVGHYRIWLCPGKQREPDHGEYPVSEEFSGQKTKSNIWMKELLDTEVVSWDVQGHLSAPSI